MNYFSYDALATTVIVIVAAIGIFVLVGNAVEYIRKWVGAYRERKGTIEDKVDFLKNQSNQHQQDYKDVVNLKRQIGTIQESVDKIDSTLESFIKEHDRDMKVLNEETALQTGAIKSLLDNIIDTNHNENLIKARKEFDDFLIRRGR